MTGNTPLCNGTARDCWRENKQAAAVSCGHVVALRQLLGDSGINRWSIVIPSTCHLLSLFVAIYVVFTYIQCIIGSRIMSQQPKKRITAMENNHLLKGMIAGLFGTLVLTIMMIIKKQLGIMPALDPVHMMTEMVSTKMGIAPSPIIGWVMHFGIGTVLWGGLFGALNSAIPGHNQLIKGLLFGVGAWLVMMIGPMPMSGAGFFASNLGLQATILTLVLHLVYGLTMGKSYQVLTRS